MEPPSPLPINLYLAQKEKQILASNNYSNLIEDSFILFNKAMARLFIYEKDNMLRISTFTLASSQH